VEREDAECPQALIWSPQAKRDLKEIFAFYAPENVTKAKQLISSIAAQGSRLEHPGLAELPMLF
jgi:plasmid stabilization system protein ParE